MDTEKRSEKIIRLSKWSNGQLPALLHTELLRQVNIKIASTASKVNFQVFFCIQLRLHDGVSEQFAIQYLNLHRGCYMVYLKQIYRCDTVLLIIN